MKSIDRLLQEFPRAQVEETRIEIDQENFDKQEIKNLERNAEGGAVAIVLQESNKVVLVKRSKMHAGWSLPGGTVEHGDGFVETIIREIKEETSISATVQDLFLVDRRLFVSPRGQTHRMDIAFFILASEPDQKAGETADSVEEGLEVGVFNVNDLPDDMIFMDKERLVRALAL